MRAAYSGDNDFMFVFHVGTSVNVAIGIVVGVILLVVAVVGGVLTGFFAKKKFLEHKSRQQA